YRTPAPTPTFATKPHQPAPHAHDFWASTAAVVLVGGGAAILLGIGLAALMLARRRRESLHGRISQFTSTMDVAEHVDGEHAHRPFLFERTLEGTRWWPQFVEDVEIARIDRSPAELLVGWMLFTLVFAVLVGAVFGPLLSLIVLVLGPVSLRST